MTDSDAAGKEPWAIALVHGIGTTSPLPMIHEVSEALRTIRPELHLSTEAEVHEVHEPAGVVRNNVIRHGSVGTAPVRIGTAHWADITFYREGLVSMIGALLMTAFGVRFFAQVATGTIPRANWIVKALAFCLRQVLQFMVQFLAIVIFPITLVALIYSLMGLLAEYIFKFSALFLQREAIATLGLIICLVIAATGISRSWPMRKERPLSTGIFGAIAFFGLLVALFLYIGDYLWIATAPDGSKHIVWFFTRKDLPEIGNHMHQLPYVLRDWLSHLAKESHYVPLADRIAIVDRTGTTFALLHMLQIGAGIVMICLTLLAVTLLALLYPVARLTGTRIRTFVFATVSVISIWIINLILLWPENLVTFAAMAEFLDDRIQPKVVTFTTVDWLTLIASSVPLDLSTDPRTRIGFMFNRYYRDTYPLMWFEAAFLVFLAAVLVLIVGVLLARWWWCRQQSRADLAAFRVPPGAEAPPSSNWPRLIISRGYVTLVMLLIIFVPYTFFAMWLHDTPLISSLRPPEWLSKWLPTYELSVGAEWARVGLIGFLLLFALFSHYISGGAKLVLDVVNHFTAPNLGFPVRGRIERRFEEMIDTLLAAGDKPNLVIIAHSQGTVITLDALLRQPWLDATLQRVRSLTVITFGSPITHVYQEYFPKLYPHLSETPLVELSRDPRVKWFNVYRIDDYVGTYIDGSIPDFPVNVPAPPGGHTNYWQKDVMEELNRQPAMRTVLA